MNRGRASAQVFLCFLMMMFMMATVGCSSKDNAPASTTYSITGTVALTGGPLQNVVVTLSGSSTGTFTTGADGKYSFTGLANGTYTLTPVLTGYVFNPNPKVIVVSGSNMIQDFVATTAVGTYYTISGTVMVGSTPLSGVTVTMSGSHDASVFTGTDGTWSFSAAGGGANTYTVTPYLSGYSFTPPYITWNSPVANSSSNTFTATLAKFTQADLVGTWDVRMLKAASSGGWKHAVITLNSSGALTAATDCLDNTGDTTCPSDITWTINTSTGVITETGSGAGANVHMTMASNKTFVAGTEDNSKLLIAQKEIPGTSYAAADVQSKNFVFHQFNVGSSNKWQYGAGSSSASGAINISSQTDPVSGTTTPGDVGVTISVDSSGVVSMSDNATWKGFLSADKKTIVGTDTESAGTEFHMLIIQITNGQSSSLSQVVGASYVHLLGTGASPAPFWAHETVSIASGGGISFADWVTSGSETAHDSGTGTMSVGSSGTATVTLTSGTTDFHGQLSYDGTFMVATETYEPGVYTLDIFTH